MEKNQHSVKTQEIMCKFCYSFTNPLDENDKLISPCNCKGSIAYVHILCLKKWRYQGRDVKSIRICEQCSSYYRVENEVIPHKSIVSLVTLIIMMLGYLVIRILLNSIFDVLFIIFRDFFIPDSSIISSYDLINGEQMGFLNTNLVNYAVIPQISHAWCLFIILLSYQIGSKPSMFSIFNYLFTFWRLNQFEFFIDRFLFGFMSTYFLKKLYNFIYTRADAGIIYFLNCK